MTVLRSGSASDVGRVRAVNEDLALESLTLFAVADGMGGHAGGEVAARTAIESLKQEFGQQASVQGLVSAVRAANRAVWERSLEDPDLRGMGTTLTAAALVATDEGDRLVLANVGDSRTYRFHDGELVQLSRDHSVAEELVDRGELSSEEAAVHPHRHILTRALGVAPEVDVDVWLVAPEAGDRYLLCSDGLTNEVSASRITGVLSSTADPQQASEHLVRIANEHGGNDNITAVVLDVLVGEEQGAPGPKVLAAGPGAPAAKRASAVTPVAADGLPAVAPGSEDAEDQPRSLLSRFGSDAAAGFRAMSERSAEVADRLKSRRVTIRVLLFVLVLAALVAAGFASVRWYVNSSYFVKMHRNEVVVYQGRMGGFLGIHPKVVWRTGLHSADVPNSERPSVVRGVEESSLPNACNYVKNLIATQAALQQSTTTTAPPPPPPGAPAPPPAPGPAPTTTTTLKYPKGCNA